jgi:hypothetical protein
LQKIKLSPENIFGVNATTKKKKTNTRDFRERERETTQKHINLTQKFFASSLKKHKQTWKFTFPF